jgi:ubiquinone/menaquinone biosynthesis C-methylase UbiE
MDESNHLKINEAKWNKWAETVDGKSLKYDYLRSAQLGVISLLNLKEAVSILDIGCGTGWALGQAAKLNGDKGTFYGVDLSEKMIEKAKENFKGRENFHFIKANAEEIHLEDNQFEIIICTNSFHHYLHPDKALKEMHRLLKLGGKVYILDPSVDFWVAKFLAKVLHLFDRAHVRLHSTKEFEKMINHAGFTYIGTEKIKWHQKVQVGEKLV